MFTYFFFYLFFVGVLGVVFGVDNGVLFWLFGLEIDGIFELFVFFRGFNGGRDCWLDLGDLGFFFGERGE